VVLSAMVAVADSGQWARENKLVLATSWGHAVEAGLA